MVDLTVLLMDIMRDNQLVELKEKLTDNVWVEMSVE
jgi:hypothetical protein